MRGEVKMLERKPVVGISLKMYQNSIEKAVLFAEKMTELTGAEDAIEQFICPEMGTLYPVSSIVKNSFIGLGAQNIAPAASGAFTGEFSINTLVEMGGSYVEIGHSERRTLFNETDEMIFKKMALTLEKGLTPVLCIGEPEKSSNVEWMRQYLERQLFLGLKNSDAEKLEKVIVAYEPVWAIGQSVAAGAHHIWKAHTMIRGILKNFFGNEIAEKMRIIYGGSVSKENIGLIVSEKDVDGAFVGRFGHDPNQYSAIVQEVKKVKKGQLKVYNREGDIV